MKKLERIIVAIDMSEDPSDILQRAMMFAKENGAFLNIIHAVETPLFQIPDFFSSKDVGLKTKGLEKEIQKLVKGLSLSGEVDYKIFVKEGSADDIILYETKLLKAQMLIMGAHTKSSKKKQRFGSTAQKVAHQSHVPLLIVKNRPKKPYANIIAPTDFATQSEQSIQFVKKICSKANVDMVNAYEAFYATDIYSTGAFGLENVDIEMYEKAEKTAAQNHMKMFKKEMGVKRGRVIDGGINSKDALLKYISKGKYDLTVLGSRGTSGTLALLGSVAYTLMREVDTDVLVYVPR